MLVSKIPIPNVILEGNTRAGPSPLTKPLTFSSTFTNRRAKPEAPSSPTRLYKGKASEIKMAFNSPERHSTFRHYLLIGKQFFIYIPESC